MENKVESKKIKIKINNLMKISLFVVLIGMPIGYKIIGRFAISNITQILGIIIIFPYIIKKMTRKYVLKVFGTLLFLVLASVISSIYYNIPVLWFHILFFFMVFIYFSFMVEESKKNTIVVNEFLSIYEKTIIPFLVVFGSIGIKDIFILHTGFSPYTFDDKSHAVIFLSFYAFISLTLLKGKRRIIISIAFMILAMTTISRLVIAFIPFYIIALYQNVNSKAKGILKKCLLGICIVLICFVVFLFIMKNQKYFLVLSRLSSSNLAATGSTRAHILLIKYALMLKIDNIFNIILGAGAGNFANALAVTNINMTELRLIDPTSYRAIFAGTIPVHSSHVQILLEFSIVGVANYIVFLWKILKQNMQNKNLVEVMFFVAFMGATLLYSTHNEMLFYCILFYLWLISVKKEKY